MVYLFAFLVPLLIVFLITPFIRYLGLKIWAVDKKNHRKIHAKNVIVKFGGVGIYFGFVAGLIIMAVYDNAQFQAHIFQISGLAVCATLALFLGMYDDLLGSRAHKKLFVQIVIACLLIKVGFLIQRIYLPGMLDIHLGVFSIPFTVLWLVGITNAINLIDGLDGLAGGIVAIACLFFSFYGLYAGEPLICYLSLALLGAVVGFLHYNFYPAKIFMGDSGSLFLGCMLASMGAYVVKAGSMLNKFFLPSLLILLLPILDTVMAVIRRLSRKQHIFTSDASHIHHFFLNRGFSQVQVVLGFYVVTVFLGLISLLVLTYAAS